MEAEITSLRSMETWRLVDLPPGRKPIGCRWTYKLKVDTEGKASRWKARLVAQGFSQKAGIDYDETFAPVARLTTIRILIAIALRHGMKIWSMDVVTAYLNGTISDDIYMSQLPHYDDGTGRVCKLLRSLYGLKQSGREWFTVARNPEGHHRLKHVDVHHHFVRELVANEQVSVTQIGTDDNAADIFTKVTSLARLQEGMMQLGLGDNRLASAKTDHPRGECLGDGPAAGGMFGVVVIPE
ncbi:hypothetical protein A4X06_0g9825 [Tilletia controversa]|uniref:Reverse transcriptase Ty1/copia-type domain-containing protein n=1 Tax=Tilletia controversa TaxID=13291 RepID=A0A8X7MHK8_9BASI|nr:hypothetical protein CF335_g9646 [Tilletia laevis]KAE8235581.1 hypothetical protein A4X06_0g9825 [Tilletia controversa]